MEHENVQKLKVLEESKPLVNDFVEFMSHSKTPYHVVENSANLLRSKGFFELKESESWEQSIKPGSKFFIIREGSCLVALAIGENFEPGGKFRIVLSHTDSPALRVKPRSKCGGEKYAQVGVTTYGGGLWRTWFDRDLTFAGKVFYKKKGESEILTKLVDVQEPLMNIPSLAIHLENTGTEFKFNKESQFVPVLTSMMTGGNGDHHPEVYDILKKQFGEEEVEIIDFELFVVDFAPAVVGGAHRDMIFSHGLDNKFSCYTGLRGLLQSCEKGMEEDDSIKVLAMFNHEEVGSRSSEGAASNLLVDITRRVSKVLKKNLEKEGGKKIPSDFFEMSIAKSFCISSDNSHAVHPNYVGSHHGSFKPKMNEGIVIKQNVNTRYATNVKDFVNVKETLLDPYEILYQKFIVKNDSRCGTTVGPITNAQTSIRTIDIGAAQLSMHSVRETVGAADVHHFVKFFTVFFEKY